MTRMTSLFGKRGVGRDRYEVLYEYMVLFFWETWLEEVGPEHLFSSLVGVQPSGFLENKTHLMELKSD